MKLKRNLPNLAGYGLTLLGASLSASGYAQSPQLEEIVVTAQRRAESAQDASISMEVIRAKTLENAGVSTAVDLARVAPAVQIAMGGTSIQLYIRGAGDFSTTAYNEAAVSQNFDGVPAARTQWINGQFFDLDRVEVLKGPQGTLYGRNAVGGALNLQPVLPTLGETDGYVALGLQNYSGKSIEGAVNVPVGESAAIRASLQVVDRDGYIDDGTNDDEHTSVRLQYLNEASDTVTWRVGVNYQDFGGRGPGQVAYVPEGTAFGGPIVPNDPWTSINDSLKGLNEFFDSLPPPISPTYIDTSRVKQDIQSWGVHANIDIDTELGTLTIIPAYQSIENASVSMPTLGFITYNTSTGDPWKSDTLSLEVRLAGESDNLEYVVGAFYWDEDQESNNWIDIANVVNQHLTADLTTTAYAAFGELTYSFSDTLRGILGLRYTDEEKTLDAIQYNRFGSAVQCPVAGTGPGGDCPSFEIGGVYEESRVNYRVGLEWDIADDSMLYATAATAFKSGGQANADLPPYDPEDVTAYTIGIKNRFFDNTLQLNADIFYNDYQDHIENLSLFDRRDVRVSALVNTGEASAKGASMELVWLPSENNLLRVSAEYLNAEYDDFVFYEFRTSLPGTVGCPSVVAPAGSPRGANFQYDCTGYEMARSPDWTGSVSYTRSFDVAGGKLDITPSMRFSSERWTRATFHPNQLAPSYEVYNLSANFTPADESYSLQAFVRNITDEAVYTGSELAPFVTGYTGYNIDAPRTYGLRLRYNF